MQATAGVARGSSSLARAPRYLSVQRSGQPLYGGPVRIPPEDPLDLLIDNEVTLQSDRSCEDGSVLLTLLRPEGEGDYAGERQDIGTLPSLFMQLSPRRLAGGLPLLDLSPRQFPFLLPPVEHHEAASSAPKDDQRQRKGSGWIQPNQLVFWQHFEGSECVSVLVDHRKLVHLGKIALRGGVSNVFWANKRSPSDTMVHVAFSLVQHGDTRHAGAHAR
jgi:hypothetical protein